MRLSDASESEKSGIALKLSLTREEGTGEEEETSQKTPNQDPLPERLIPEIRASQPVEAVCGAADWATMDWAEPIDPRLVVPCANILDDDEDDDDDDDDDDDLDYFDDDLDDEDDDLIEEDEDEDTDDDDDEDDDVF